MQIGPESTAPLQTAAYRTIAQSGNDQTPEFGGASTLSTILEGAFQTSDGA